MRNFRGFSLLEILIAGALLAGVGVLLMTTLSSSVDLKDRVGTDSLRYHTVRLAMSRMTRELAMAYISNNRNANVVVVDTAFKGQKDKVSFDAFGGASKKKDAKESDMREISYYVQSEFGKERESLFRKEKVNPTKHLGDEGKAQLFCPNVKKIEFAYYDSKNKEWRDTWSAQSGAADAELPARVRITLTVVMPNKQERVFTSQTELTLNKPIKL